MDPNGFRDKKDMDKTFSLSCPAGLCVGYVQVDFYCTYRLPRLSFSFDGNCDTDAGQQVVSLFFV